MSLREDIYDALGSYMFPSAARWEAADKILAEMYRHLDEKPAKPDTGPVFGQPGVRDPDLPCGAFKPGAPAGDCLGDGHYLCGECSEFDRARRPTVRRTNEER